MSRGVSHKAVALLDKRNDEQSLQRVREYVEAVCSKGNNGCTPNSKDHGWQKITGVALMNGQKDLPFCDTGLDSLRKRVVNYVGKIAHHPK